MMIHKSPVKSKLQSWRGWASVSVHEAISLCVKIQLYICEIVFKKS